MIVVINGFPQSGKDQFISFCQEIRPNVHNISTIDSVKSIATIMGWDGTKDNKSRDFLSDLKALWIKYNDGPSREALNACKKLIEDEPDSVVFVHCREPEEIAKIVGGCEPGKVRTLVIDRKVSGLPDNASDNNVLEYDYTDGVYNDGTLEELKDQARKFISQF